MECKYCGVEWAELSNKDYCDDCDAIRTLYSVAALVGLLSDSVTIKAMGEEADARGLDDPAVAAMSAFELADAMMEARKPDTRPTEEYADNRQTKRENPNEQSK